MAGGLTGLRANDSAQLGSPNMEAGSGLTGSVQRSDRPSRRKSGAAGIGANEREDLCIARDEL
jgi:hypothetical protein